jgi:(1->4)-alpha-D-glucan 1-alpha-D-glucosylmutase
MISRRFKRELDGRAAPDRNDEYLLYQTLVGAWPAQDDAEATGSFAGRICGYMEKATKEAKRRTSWVNPDGDYDQALREFVTRLLAPGSPFLGAFVPFQRLVALYGSVNSLAQALLKITAPGIPDFYQGSELWDLSLVDPDNRRPVDFARRQTLLDDMRARIDQSPSDLAPLCTELLNSWSDGRVKMYVTERALTLRRAFPALFRSGSYDPLSAGGEHSDHMVALARRDGTDSVVVVVPRLTARLTGFDGRLPLGQSIWADTWISLDHPGLAGVYTDRFSGLRIATELRDGVPVLPAGALFGSLPVAMLKREETP